MVLTGSPSVHLSGERTVEWYRTRCRRVVRCTPYSVNVHKKKKKNTHLEPYVGKLHVIVVEYTHNPYSCLAVITSWGCTRAQRPRTIHSIRVLINTGLLQYDCCVCDRRIKTRCRNASIFFSLQFNIFVPYARTSSYHCRILFSLWSYSFFTCLPPNPHATWRHRIRLEYINACTTLYY